VTEGATVEPNPEVGVPFEEVGTKTWEVSEEPTHLCNQGKPPNAFNLSLNILNLSSFMNQNDALRSQELGLTYLFHLLP